MKKTALIIALSLTTASGFATAASNVAGGLPVLQQTVESNYQALDARISGNAADIDSNTAGIAANGDAISNNAAGIADNASRLDQLESNSGGDSDSIDYRDYSSTLTNKTYSVVMSDPCVTRESRNFTRSGTDVTINRIRSGPEGTCQNKTFHYIADADSRRLASKDNNNRSGVRVNSVDIPSTPIVILTSNMTIGNPVGSAGLMRRDYGGGEVELSGAFVDTATVLGKESVTVPYGTLENCIKVHRLRTSPTQGNFNRMSWYCEGLGEVKRIQQNPGDLSFGIWKLISVSPDADEG